MADLPQDHHSAPTVIRKSVIPPGVVPRHAQTLVIGGIALLMVIVIAFSGGNAPKKKATQPVTPALVDPSQARIHEYREHVEKQARKLAAEQSQLDETKKAIGLAPGAPLQRAPGYAPPSYPARERSWIDAEREKREYEALFASNVALSHRRDTGAPARVPAVSSRIPDVSTGTQRAADASKTNKPQAKEYRLFEGTVIETVLTNRLDGAFSGPVNCMVTTNIYSHDHQHVLVPQGSRVLGEVQKVDGYDQKRLAVTFHRLLMPNGYSVSLDQFQGLNQIGETGLRDKVNRHYMQIFGVSLAIGAIAGFSQANTRYGADTSAEDAYRQGVAASLSQSSLRILDRYLNVLPTFTIREGHRVKVYLSGDLLLPAYDNDGRES